MSARKQQASMVTLGGVIILGILYYFLIFSPSLTRERTFRERLRKKETDVVQMLRLKAERQELIARHDKAVELLKRRGKNFTLLSFLEAQSREVGISARIQYMKPVSFPETASPMGQVGVELRLDGISMDELVRYLYRIEYSNNFLAVPRMKVQRMKGKGGEILLGVTMQVTTYTQQQQSNKDRISSL
jgi:Type II secretion system (T2SS), protein M subtype b